MHQDQRIGLALAVLLIGAAGAFFFRNDPKPASSPPRLKSARELDARIAEKAISPYLQSGDDRDGPGVTAKKVGHPSDTDASALPQLDLPDFFGPEDRSNSGQQPASSRNNTIQDLAPIPVPAANEGNSSLITDSGKPFENSVSSGKLHVVQKGETLSSIAARELGSSARFHDVFEANRDQLKDANDVRVGMSLRIPPRNSGRSESATAKSRDRAINAAPPLLPAEENRTDVGDLPPIAVDPDKQPPTPGDAPSKKKFEPAKRPPLGIKSMGTQSSEAEPQNKPVRKLTQLPPGNVGGKVAR